MIDAAGVYVVDGVRTSLDRSAVVATGRRDRPRQRPARRA